MVHGRPAFPVRTALMVAAILMTISPVGASAKLAHASTTFTVNSTADPGTGSCDLTECTLREAINAANGAAGADTITFDVSGPGCVDGVCTISPSTELPIITDTVIINGYTQGDGTLGDPSDDATANTLAVGDNAVLKIELDGAEAGNGLKIEADNSTVKGLVISNWENGVFLNTAAKNNKVQGNFIGTDASGANLSNNIGVVVLGDENMMGGTTAAARNVISGNGAGVQFNSANGGNKVQGNYIGTEANGTEPLGNNNGVVIQSSPKNTIGGTTAAERNVISGNSTFGVWIIYTGASGNKVQGNFIGTSAADGTMLANGDDGVSIQSDADNNLIGGTATGAGNIISGNGDDGVEVRYYHDETDPIGSDPDPATGNRILSNSIYGNDALGIELRFDPNETAGVTCNDIDPPPDGDDGPNHLQNYPEITSARRAIRHLEGHRRKVTVIRGTLNSTPSSATIPQKFNLQFFGSPEADPPSGPSPCGPSSFGEGKRFLDQKNVTTDAEGFATFTFITTKKVPRGQVITATATNQSTGDTSEFSRARTVS